MDEKSIDFYASAAPGQVTASSPPAGSGWTRGGDVITGDLLDEVEKDPQFVQATRSAGEASAVSCADCDLPLRLQVLYVRRDVYRVRKQKTKLAQWNTLLVCFKPLISVRLNFKLIVYF